MISYSVHYWDRYYLFMRLLSHQLFFFFKSSKIARRIDHVMQVLAQHQDKDNTAKHQQIANQKLQNFVLIPVYDI